MPKPKVVYNEDGNLLMCLEPGRAAEAMREYLTWTTDRIPIDIYEFCVATPDVCYFGSKKGEVLGRRMIDKISQYMREVGHEDLGKPDRPRQLVHHVGYGIELLRQEGHDALDINGVAVDLECINRTIDTTDTELPWTWAEIDLADCPPFRGDNELGVTWRSQVDHGLDVPYLEELDVVADA